MDLLYRHDWTLEEMFYTYRLIESLVDRAVNYSHARNFNLLKCGVANNAVLYTISDRE